MSTEPDWFQKYVDLAEAVRDLYYAAHWYPDRPVAAQPLWARVRDAAGIEPGLSHKILGEPRGPVRMLDEHGA